MSISVCRLFFPPVLLAAALVCTFLLSGCGGGGSVLSSEPPASLSERAVGAATFSVVWPDRAALPRLGSRLLPVASNSIVLTINRGGATLASQTLTRPYSSVTLPGLPVGLLTATAAAYPSLNGTGAVQASASAPLVVVSGQSTPLTLTLADSITSLVVSSTFQTLPLGGILTLIATARDAAGNVVLTGGSVGWTSANMTVATVSSSGLVSGLAVGSSLIRATDSESGISGTFNVACAGSLPYGVGPAAVPGTVEAENYDFGGEGTAYHDVDAGNNGGAYRNDDVDIQTTTDTGGGYALTSVAAGEWTKYTVNVATAGVYTLGFRVATPYTGTRLHLENSSGTNLTGPVACPNTTGFGVWQTVNANVTLPTGVQTLKVVADVGNYNFNYITFRPAGQLVTGTPYDDGLGSYSGSSFDAAAKAYDGSTSTFYDCASINGGYTGIDAGSPLSISSIVYAPRQSYESRMPGGVFEGSNTSATSGYTTLATVTSRPGDGLNNVIAITDPTAYRWLRYRGPNGSSCNVAEVRFYH